VKSDFPASSLLWAFFCCSSIPVPNGYPRESPTDDSFLALIRTDRFRYVPSGACLGRRNLSGQRPRRCRFSFLSFLIRLFCVLLRQPRLLRLRAYNGLLPERPSILSPLLFERVIPLQSSPLPRPHGQTPVIDHSWLPHFYCLRIFSKQEPVFSPPWQGPSGPPLY